MTPLIIIGAGGHAGMVIDSVTKGTTFKIVGLLDDTVPIGEFRHGCKVIGKVDAARNHPAHVHIAVGDIRERKGVFDRLKIAKERYATVIHPSCVIGSVCSIACGVFLGPNSTVGHTCKIGIQTILNTGASLDHNSMLGDFSHMAPKSATGGWVDIGNHTMIGIGALIRDGVGIGDDCLIGMGSVVVRDIPNNTIGWGNPFSVRSLAA